MTDLLKGKAERVQTAEDLARLERMERLRLEIMERRLRRVRFIQSLHR